MTGIFYIGQEDIDFAGPFNNTSLYPFSINTDGVRARTGSSPHVCGTYSVIDAPVPLSTSLSGPNFSLIGLTNNLSFSCRFYIDGAISTPTGNEYFLNFANSNPDYTENSIIIGFDSNVYLWDRIPSHSFTYLATMSQPFTASTLQKLDVEIIYAVSGSINIWLDGTNILSFSGDLTNGEGNVGLGFYGIIYGSGGGTGTNIATYWSEIILADSTDIKNYYSSYISTSSLFDTQYTTSPYNPTDYSDPSIFLYTTNTLGYIFNFPLTVTTPPYYNTGDIIIYGQSTFGTYVGDPVNSQSALMLGWFSLNDGIDTVYNSTVYYAGVFFIALSLCLPRAIDSVTGINIESQRADGSLVGPAEYPFNLTKCITRFVFGSGTVNPNVPPTNINAMIL